MQEIVFFVSDRTGLTRGILMGKCLLAQYSDNWGSKRLPGRLSYQRKAEDAPRAINASVCRILIYSAWFSPLVNHDSSTNNRRLWMAWWLVYFTSSFGSDAQNFLYWILTETSVYGIVRIFQFRMTPNQNVWMRLIMPQLNAWWWHTAWSVSKSLTHFSGCFHDDGYKPNRLF